MTETEYYLICLMEECDEISQRCSKALRFGLDEIQPGQTLTNAERIQVELCDLQAVMARLSTTVPRPPNQLELVEAKLNKLDKYIAYSIDLGIVQ